MTDVEQGKDGYWQEATSAGIAVHRITPFNWRYSSRHYGKCDRHFFTRRGAIHHAARMYWEEGKFLSYVWTFKYKRGTYVDDKYIKNR